MHPLTPPPSKQAEFARHGFREGYPLWYPDPILLPQDRQDKGLQIGDIGTIDHEDGHFHTIFNIYYPPDRSLAGYGLVPAPDIYIDETFHDGHVFSSPETSWRNGGGRTEYYTGPQAEARSRSITQYTASLSKDGAHIIVPEGARCFKLRPRDKSVLKAVAANPQLRSTWFNLAGENLGSKPSTLHLITGLCQTRSWSLVSFNRKDDQVVHVCCELVEEDAKLQVTSSHWAPRGRFAYKTGPPVERQGKDNQTIFIQSFAITHKDSIRHQRLSTAVPQEQPEGSKTMALQGSHEKPNNNRFIRFLPFSQHTSRSRGTNMAAEALALESTAVVQHIPPTSVAFHPLEIVNQFLLAKQPSAGAAITHDTLWMAMLNKGQLQKLQELETMLDSFMLEHYLIIMCNGVVYPRDYVHSLRHFGIAKGSPVDLTDCVKQVHTEKISFSKCFFEAVYQSTLCMPHGTIKVIIKSIDIEQSRNSSSYWKQEQVQSMIDTWSELDHINILPLIWTTEDHEQSIVVLPWPESGTLMSYLEHIDGELTDAQMLTLLTDIASGLYYLHSKDISYGGLSGSNIAVGAHGTALLSDLSRMTLPDEDPSPFTQLGQDIEILRWATPEMLVAGNEHGSRLSKESDIYSFGGIMLLVLSGQVPYHDYSTKEEVVAAISRDETPKRPNGLRPTDDQWAVMRRCWLSPPFAKACSSGLLISRVVMAFDSIVKTNAEGFGSLTTVAPTPLSGPAPAARAGGQLPSKVSGGPLPSSTPPSGRSLIRLSQTPVRGGGMSSGNPRPSGFPTTRMSGPGMKHVGRDTDTSVKRKK